MSRLLIVGPPGAGKGTQAARLAESFGIPAIATGDIFRWNITNETPLGLEVKSIVDSGDYVPDTLTNELVKNRLLEEDALDGFLLDGYPRTTDQVSYLERMLSGRDQSVDAVIQLVADREEVVSRLRKRAIEQGRVDDSEEAIRHRQDVFDRETAPLLDIYKGKGLLVTVDGLGDLDEITQRIMTGLAARAITPDAVGADAAVSHSADSQLGS